MASDAGAPQGVSGASAGACAAGVLTSCPGTMAGTGVACIGDFVCDYQAGCTACGCCSSATICRDGKIAYFGFNDGCMVCLGFGGMPGAGGGSGSAGASGVDNAGAGGD